MKRFIPIISLVIACTGCASQEAKKNTVRTAIETLNTAFSEAYGRGDMEALAALYTQDAIVLPPGGEMVTGRQAIADFWRAVRKSGVKNAVLTTRDVDVGGDLACETGTALLTLQPQGKKPATSSVKYVVVWKRQEDESWQLHRDIWNDLPPEK